jgi:hypothetical protein
MKVLFSPFVQDFYYELEAVLLEKGYFSFKENADNYVADLFQGIQNNLPNLQHKPAPERYAKYGEDLHYVSFVKNKRTTWYAFFTKYEENNEIIYLVSYMGNNHTEAQYL